MISSVTAHTLPAGNDIMDAAADLFTRIEPSVMASSARYTVVVPLRPWASPEHGALRAGSRDWRARVTHLSSG